MPGAVPLGASWQESRCPRRQRWSRTFSQRTGLSPNLFRSPQVHPFDAQVRAQATHRATPVSARSARALPDCGSTTNEEPTLEERVTIEVADGVADVRLNRPDKLNALDGAMFRAIAAAGDAVAADRSVRAVVLSGEGRGFCAGLDIASFMGGGGTSEDPPVADDGPTEGFGLLGGRTEGRIANLAQQVAYTWTSMPVPVIAAVHGVALGGGIQIALGADIRIVAPDAKMSVLEIRWGLLPDMTGVQSLVRLVGLDRAKELAFTGRFLSGTEAVELGVATRVADDPRAAAHELAAEIAGKNPMAIRGMKALFNDAGTRPLVDSFKEETRLMAELIGSPNQMEAVMANMQKRDPVFSD
ncbi:MAG: crotonase/enoyl-CoA hydratase family protein [Geminicoccaceae bacterium]|nr:crotonase/enoyl-CoA hydratase family protein [Geminicoccaceae bacterium]